MKKIFKNKKLLSVFILTPVLFFSIGSLIGYSCACTFDGYVWPGHWKDKNNIIYLNSVTNNVRLKGLVNNAALDNWNRSQSIIRFVQGTHVQGRYVYVQNVSLSSVEWTGKAEGASYNWDSDYHYKTVYIYLNEAKGINSYSDSKLLGLIAHEFGHSLGLKHRTASNYLMYCYDSRTVNRPNSDEIFHLSQHYNHSH